MATIIKPKRSETSSSAPTTANLAVGEIAINTADQKIYTRDSGNNIVTLAQPGLLNVVEDTTPQLGGSLDTNSNDINFADNAKANFGADSDLQIYHDASNSYIKDAGTGDLRIEGSFIRLVDTSNSHTTATFASSGVNLRHTNNIKFQTTTDGTLTCGSSTITDGTISWPFASKSDNLHIGTDASCSLTTGTNNIAVGCQSLKLNEDGANNIAIGQNSLCCATTPSCNIVIGKNSLCASDECTFVGCWNGSSYPTITRSTEKNIVIGNDLLTNETMAFNNTVIGNNIATCSTAYICTWGCTCTCNGQSAIPYDEKTANNNTLIGNCISPYSSRLDKNVIVGTCISFTNQATGIVCNSQIFGHNILNCTATDSCCSGLSGKIEGSFIAGSNMFCGQPVACICESIIIGDCIGSSIPTYCCRYACSQAAAGAGYNSSVIIGSNAARYGASNASTMIGEQSGSYGWNNFASTFVGERSGRGSGDSFAEQRKTMYFENTAIGASSMAFAGDNCNTNGADLWICENTAIGSNTLQQVSGCFNTSIGGRAGELLTGGSCNVLIGSCSGRCMNTGSCNITIGRNAGCILSSGSNNIVVGTDVDASSATVSNETTIGGACLRFPGMSSTSGDILCYNGSHWVSGTTNHSYSVDGSTSGTSIYISDTTCSFTTGNGNTIVGERTGCSITSSAYNTLIGYCTGHLISSQSNASNIAIGSGVSGAYGASGGISNITIGSEAMGGCSASTGGDSKGCCNIAIGTYSGYNLFASACYNVFIGTCAGRQTTCGDNNIALGYNALSLDTSNVTADNIAIGQNAGCKVTGTIGNVAIGTDSLRGTTVISGACNTTIGFCTGSSTTTGCQNTLIGACAGRTITTGNTNIVIGFNATPSSTTVSNEITLGDASITSLRIPGLQSSATDGQVLTYCSTNGNIVLKNSSGCNWDPLVSGALCNIYISNTACSFSSGGLCNTVVGHLAGCSLATSDRNTLIGLCAGMKLTGSLTTNNVAIGNGSLGQVECSSHNTAIGYCVMGGCTPGTGSQNGKGCYNTAIGSRAGFCLASSGNCNILIGRDTAFNLTTGDNNIALGAYAMERATTNGNQVVIGQNAVQYLIGGNNLAIGNYAVRGKSTGDCSAGNNIGIGNGSAAGLTTGSCNIAMGHLSGDVSSGKWNMFLGHTSGYHGTQYVTGCCNVVLGVCAGQSLANNNSGSNNIIIGYNADFSGTMDGTCSNTIIIGNSSHNQLIIPGLSAGQGQTLCFNGSGFVASDSAGVTPWQAVCTSAFTATAGLCYFVNTTSAAITATLPASASLGDEIHFKDYNDTFDTNNLTIGRNSHNIEGSAADLTVATEGAGFTLVYVDSTKGWLLKDV